MHSENNTKQQDAGPRSKLYLLYHELSPNPGAYSYACTTAAFANHLDLFVRMRETERNHLWPELTFDDGHISNFEQALPILQSKGLTAQFFITAGWTDKIPGYMGWSELRALHEAGHAIGAHGWSHTLLTHCAAKELDKELRGARLLLEDKLGISITSMSLPGGRYNNQVIAACMDAGYSKIFTSVPKSEADPIGMLVGRLNIHANRSLEWFSRILQPDSRELGGLERRYRMKSTVMNILGDRLYYRLWALANRRGKNNEAAGDENE